MSDDYTESIEVQLSEYGLRSGRITSPIEAPTAQQRANAAQNGWKFYVRTKAIPAGPWQEEEGQ